MKKVPVRRAKNQRSRPDPHPYKKDTSVVNDPVLFSRTRGQHIVSIQVETGKRKGPIMLVIAPTRELAMQSQEVLDEASNLVKISRNTCAYDYI